MGNLKRETDSLLTVGQNNAIRTSYIKTKIDIAQHNSKFWLCGNKLETINNIVSECSKLARKEYKTKYDGKGNPRETVKKIEISPHY